MNDYTPLKRCAKCQQLLPATPEYFRRASKEKDGLKHSCKDCYKMRDADYRERNPNIQKDWYEQNKEYAIAKAQDWYAEHKEQVSAQGKKRRAENPEAQKEKNKKQYERIKNDPVLWARELERAKERAKANPERTREVRRGVKLRRKDKARAEARERDRRNPEKARAKSHKRLALKRNAEGHHSAADIRRIYAEQNGCCAYCGVTLDWNVPRQVHVDHIIPLSKGGSNWPDNIAIACQQCNCSKADKTLDEWKQIRGW